MKRNRRIFTWHHWCGLAVGLFLLLMSISGAILVFADDYEAATDSKWSKVDNASGSFSYDASLSEVSRLYPGWEIRTYGSPAINEAIIYELRNKEARKRVYAHPVEGTILHVDEEAHKKWYKQLLLFHYTWFSGTAGKIFVFIIGILFLITLLTGLYVYRRSLIKVFRFRVKFNKRTRRSYHSSLHRIVGVWSLIFNLFIVATGLSMAGQVAIAALKAGAGSKSSATNQTFAVDHHRDALLQANKDFEVHLLRIRPAGNSIQFIGRYTSDPSYYGLYYSSFTINAETGIVENKTVLSEQSLGKRLLSMSGPLHFGNWGGLPVKILYCLFGFTPALLSITGFVIWRTKRRK
ncbi:MAG TPA: PepSY-associated TM helix domain-containing protein [Chitinophagaceae bacterium]